MDNIDWAFKGSETIKDIFIQRCRENKWNIIYFDNLLRDLREYKCNGIPEKLSRDIRTFEQILSFFSELKFAKYLAPKCARISMIPTSTVRSADIIFSDGGSECLIEVTSMRDTEISNKIMSYIRSFLMENKDLGYLIGVELKEELSKIELNREERKKQYDMLKNSLDTFNRIVLSKPHATSPFKIDTEGAIFNIELTEQGKSILMYVQTACVKIEDDELLPIISNLILWKAEKRASFDSDYKKMKYYVGFDCEIDLIGNNLFDELSYGTSETYHERLRKEWHEKMRFPILFNPNESKIRKASKTGWMEFLAKKFLIPDSSKLAHRSKEGIFISEVGMDNVTGVIVRFRTGKFGFYPNPFCEKEINLEGETPFFVT